MHVTHSHKPCLFLQNPTSERILWLSSLLEIAVLQTTDSNRLSSTNFKYTFTLILYFETYNIAC